ncbi:MAG: SGNH/GDSL hydrolase family protein [Verrucomicrobiota bacterium]
MAHPYRIYLPLISFFSSVLPTQAQNTPPAAAVVDFPAIAPRMELNDGDSFVFLGDSITHQCLYTQYVEDYVYTRYPKKRIHFHNAGVGGDAASNALTRFDEDVAAYHPKAVSILLGMNDGRYRAYDQAIFDTYQAGMTTILDKIAGIGASAFPMTPTMHDARAARMAGKTLEPRDTYYNGVLSLYGAWLREVAQQRGLGFVDMYTPLNQLTLEQRRSDPRWTMIPDAVHPGAAGQFVMATALIGDIFPKSSVGGVTIQQKDGKWSASAANGKVSDVEGTETISFTLETNSLPWVVPAEAAEGYKLTHAGHKMSNEKITVRNLTPGKYEIKIDGISIGQWTDGQLAFGVEIEENNKTPQYQQALKVAELNKRRNDEAYHLVRNEYGALKSKRRKLAESEGKPEAATLKADFDAWFVGMPDRVKALLEKARGFEDEIYKTNQPQPHRYEVAPVKAS